MTVVESLLGIELTIMSWAAIQAIRPSVTSGVANVGPML